MARPPGQGGLFGAAPDLDPSELQRIEALRGPQGTLYGAASMGGLVKYVTIDPDVTRLEAARRWSEESTNRKATRSRYNLRCARRVDDHLATATAPTA